MKRGPAPANEAHSHSSVRNSISVGARLDALRRAKSLIKNALEPGSPYGGEFEPSMGFEPHLRLAP